MPGAQPAVHDAGKGWRPAAVDAGGHVPPHVVVGRTASEIPARFQ